jgi:hypothetical protein
VAAALAALMTLPSWGLFSGEFVAAALVGSIFGAGVGLAVGAGRKVPAPCPRVSNAPLVLSRRRPDSNPGLSRLDVCLAAVYALTATGLVTVGLLIGFGERGLVLFAMEQTPFAGLGPGSAKLGLLGSLAVFFCLPPLAFFSYTAPRRSIARAQRAGVAASGFVSGLAWPIVLFGFLL